MQMLIINILIIHAYDTFHLSYQLNEAIPPATALFIHPSLNFFRTYHLDAATPLQ